MNINRIAVAIIVTITLTMMLYMKNAKAEPKELQKPVLCDTLENVVSAVAKQFGEKPMWAGKDKATQYVITFNEKTKSWSFVQFDKDMACVLGTGEGGQLIFIPNLV